MTLFDKLPTDLLVAGYWETRKVFIDGTELLPEASLQVRNHSPDGFNWSYGGSGPAQLALAILLKYMPAGAAQALYQSFKFNVVAGWPKEDFIAVLNLKGAIERIASENADIIERLKTILAEKGDTE